jgi:hypothetical protein
VTEELLKDPDFVQVLNNVVLGGGKYNLMALGYNKGTILTAAQALVETGESSPGQLVIYERTSGDEDTIGITHVALSLGGKRMMTLNGEGRPVGQHDIGHWGAVFPNDGEARLAIGLLEQGWQVHIIDPPWMDLATGQPGGTA